LREPGALNLAVLAPIGADAEHEDERGDTGEDEIRLHCFPPILLARM
jgi:hypothetical protein